MTKQVLIPIAVVNDQTGLICYAVSSYVSRLKAITATSVEEIHCSTGGNEHERCEVVLQGGFIHNITKRKYSIIYAKEEGNK